MDYKNFYFLVSGNPKFDGFNFKKMCIPNDISDDSIAFIEEIPDVVRELLLDSTILDHGDDNQWVDVAIDKFLNEPLFLPNTERNNEHAMNISEQGVCVDSHKIASSPPLPYTGNTELLIPVSEGLET